MLAWWNSLTILEQVFACIASAATVVLIIQSVLLLFGVGFGGGEADAGGLDGGIDSDFDTDFDTAFDGDAQGDFDGTYEPGVDTGDGGSGLSLFTVRGLVAFFAVGGWMGLALVKYTGAIWAIIIAFLAGTAAMVGIALLFKAALKLQDRGNLDIRNAIGKTGRVYLSIPPGETGQGKVTVMVQERLVELDAVTKSAHEIKTGAIIRVSNVIDSQTVLVELPEEKTNNGGGISQWIQS